MSHKFNNTILREYDIRGIIDDTLSEADAYAIGRSFGSIVKRAGGQTVAVGRDGRLSSPGLAEKLCQGLIESGVDALDVGLGPTPMLYFAVHHLQADGGIQITGSHNPPNYNGFKMMLGHRSFYADRIQELGQIALKGDWTAGSGNRKEVAISEAYVARLLQDFHGKRPINIVWDAGNGVAGPIMKELAAAIPGKHKLLFADVDGTFPNHHPDPTEPENLEDLIAAIHSDDYELGIGFDGDADRIGVVDSTGRIVWGDQLLQYLAEDILKRNPGATIIADVKSSNSLFSAIEAMGGNPLMYKTGHSIIKDKMIETNSPLSGEMSGHIFYKDGFYGHDDALYVAIRLIDLLCQENKTLKDFADNLPTAFNTPEIRIDCEEEEKFEIIEKIKIKLEQNNAKYSMVDGVRVTNDHGWWLLRASNTQAVLVARAESQNSEGLSECIDEINTYLSSCNYKYQIQKN